MRYTPSIIVTLLWIGCSFSINNKNKVPSFDLLLIDSTTILNTENIPEGKPFVLIYFSPDCEHCQKETEDIIKNIDSLKNASLYYITSDPFERLVVFKDYYKTNKYSNIILCKDYKYEFIKNLKPTTTPYSIVYNREKIPVAVFAGESKVTDLIKIVKRL